MSFLIFPAGPQGLPVSTMHVHCTPPRKVAFRYAAFLHCSIAASRAAASSASAITAACASEKAKTPYTLSSVVVIRAHCRRALVLPAPPG